MEIKDIIGVAIYLIGLGVLWGRQDSKSQQLERENADRKKEIADVRGQTQRDIEEIKELFLTQDKEPKYISYSAHDKLQQSCQNMIMIQIKHIQEDQVKIKECQGRIEQILMRKYGANSI